MKNIAVFASGNGSNFEAIVSACERGEIDAKVCIMVCDKPNAYVVERAKRHGVESFVFSPKEYGSKSEYENRIIELLDGLNVDLVCLAGYMRVVGDDLLKCYEGRMINIHPALLPSFKGPHAIQRAFDFGVKVFGVTVHHVTEELDGGEIIMQRGFEYYGDDVDELESKIHAVEHVLFVEAINKVLETK